MTNIIFRPYCNADRQACTSVFDGRVLGAFGLFVDGENVKVLNWILLDPQTQGIGVGSKIMERVIHLSRSSQTRVVKIAASHKSAPFFARFGATTTSSTKGGWGPGMDRVDMELSL